MGLRFIFMLTRNDRTVSDERSIVGPDDLSADGLIKLSLGKKKHILVKAD